MNPRSRSRRVHRRQLGESKGNFEKDWTGISNQLCADNFSWSPKYCPSAFQTIWKIPSPGWSMILPSVNSELSDSHSEACQTLGHFKTGGKNYLTLKKTTQSYTFFRELHDLGVKCQIHSTLGLLNGNVQKIQLPGEKGSSESGGKGKWLHLSWSWEHVTLATSNWEYDG